MNQVVKYTPGELARYKGNIIIQGVPVEYFDDDTDAAVYLARVKDGSRWKASIRKIIDNFDPLQFGNLFYCRKCRRLEDGAHRLVIARHLGIKTVNVRTGGGSCYKNYVSAGRTLRRDSTFIGSFYKAIEKNPTAHKLDKRWLEASAGDKWPMFSPLVDFRGRTFLDVGANAGYSVIEAWNRMAVEVTGIEVRKDAVAIGGSIKTKLRISDNRITFIKGDWRDTESGARQFDIVMSMGLFHYFGRDEYGELFRKLLAACRETLIIEMRLRPGNPNRELMKSGIQTLPTDTWLEDELRNSGFRIVQRFARKPDRELWVAERKGG